MRVELSGRFSERQELGELLTQPKWRVMVGAPGSGKTALIHWLLQTAQSRGVSSIVIRPVQIEASIAMSAVSDVVSRTDPGIIGQLSDAHQLVLADLVAARPVDDPGLVRAAFSAMLAASQHNGMLLLILDDAQWIDRQSAETIAFACRRSLRGSSLLAAFRTKEHSLLFDALTVDPSERIELGPLEDAHIAAIIEAESPLTPALRIGLARYADGNPLRAREIGRAAKRGAEALFTSDNLSVRANPLVSAVEVLDKSHLDVLYAVSQLRDPQVDVLSKMFPAPVVRAALVAAADAGHSVTVDRRVLFDHPLYGDAVASMLTADQRRTIHGRIAPAVDDPIERGRHLSLSSTVFDNSTRMEIFSASTHAASQGSVALALQLAFRAVDGIEIPDLTVQSPELSIYVNAQRWLANLEFRVDDPDAASRRLRQLLDGLVDGPHQVRLSLDLAGLLSWSKTLSVGIGTYQSILAQAHVDDASVAEAGMQLAMLQVNARTIPEAVASAARGREAGQRVGGQVEAEAMAMDVFVRFLAGGGFDTAALRRASQLEDLQNWLSVQCPPFSLGPFLYAWCEDERALDQFETRRSVFRARGSSTALVMGIAFEVNMLCSRGHTQQAQALVQLGLDVAEFDNELTRSLSQLAAARLLAHGGQCDEAEQQLAPAEQSFRNLEFKLGSIEAANVRMAMLSAAQDRTSVAALGSTWMDSMDADGFREPAVLPGLLDLIEASGSLVSKRQGLGDVSLLDRLVTRLSSVTNGSVTNAERPDLVAATLWARAFQSVDNQAAIDEIRLLFHQATAAFAVSGRMFWEARAQLALGRIERREGARRAATELFRTSLSLFESCCALRWCEVVRAEDKRLTGKTDEGSLTVIEVQVAQLAADGKSNKEIAADLFISAKTVESHLGSAYRKLGINRRTQLHTALVAHRL
jgi:DNA-binding CsgD family transcriptional regulator